MFRRAIASLVILCFSCTVINIPQARAAMSSSVVALPTPGSMVNLSPAYEPALIKGLTIHKDNPFLFDFIVDTGHSGLAGDELKKEGDRLVKYFFACLTIPEKDLWVNLSPYEKDRMVPQALGQTALGRDLLAEDYILKQLTASLIYPEKDLGKAFWDRVYAKAQQMYGTTQIPVNTFNKVWIVADKASVYEHGQTAFVVDGHLKVMLEEDYLAMQKHSSSLSSPNASAHGRESRDSGVGDPNTTHSIGSQIVRDLVLPEIEKEVNTGKNFSTLRQIFNSLILATWYKKNLKEALINQVYADKSTVKGVNLTDTSVKEQIYQQYLKAYKKGVFNYVKEEPQADGQTIPKKYFSGGFVNQLKITEVSPAMASEAISPTGTDFAMQVLFEVNKGQLENSDAAMVGMPRATLEIFWEVSNHLEYTHTDLDVIRRIISHRFFDSGNTWAGFLEAASPDDYKNIYKPRYLGEEVVVSQRNIHFFASDFKKYLPRFTSDMRTSLTLFLQKVLKKTQQAKATDAINKFIQDISSMQTIADLISLATQLVEDKDVLKAIQEAGAPFSSLTQRVRNRPTSDREIQLMYSWISSVQNGQADEFDRSYLKNMLGEYSSQRDYNNELLPVLAESETGIKVLGFLAQMAIVTKIGDHWYYTDNALKFYRAVLEYEVKPFDKDGEGKLQIYDYESRAGVHDYANDHSVNIAPMKDLAKDFPDLLTYLERDRGWYNPGSYSFLVTNKRNMEKEVTKFRNTLQDRIATLQSEVDSLKYRMSRLTDGAMVTVNLAKTTKPDAAMTAEAARDLLKVEQSASPMDITKAFLSRWTDADSSSESRRTLQEAYNVLVPSSGSKSDEAMITKFVEEVKTKLDHSSFENWAVITETLKWFLKKHDFHIGYRVGPITIRENLNRAGLDLISANKFFELRSGKGSAIFTPQGSLGWNVEITGDRTEVFDRIFLAFAMDGTKKSDQAQMSSPGGIDLNTQDMGMTITKDAQGGVKVNFDPAMIANIRIHGVQSALPIIIRVTPMLPTDLPPLLGLAPAHEEKLASIS